MRYCNKNLILPIIIPIISFSIMYGVTWAKKSPPKNLEDSDIKEMKRWSASPNLKINDPQYNPFIPRPLRPPIPPSDR